MEGVDQNKIDKGRGRTKTGLIGKGAEPKRNLKGNGCPKKKLIHGWDKMQLRETEIWFKWN